MTEDEHYSTAADEPKLPEDFEKVLYEMCRSLEGTNGLRNGVTALYWHLISVCQQHAKENCK